LLLVGALMPARGGEAAVVVQGSGLCQRQQGPRSPTFSRSEPGGQGGTTSQGLQPTAGSRFCALGVSSVIIFSSLLSF